jgi:hypothetical protein
MTIRRSILLGFLGMFICLYPIGAAKAAIIFSDDFEAGNFDRWDRDGAIPSSIRITTDPQNVFRGQRAVEFALPPGTQTGIKLVKWFMPGYDQVYARWYMKFDKGFDQGNLMHMNKLLGNRTDDKWSAFGEGGRNPTSGTDFFTTALEPWRDWGRYPAPGEMFLYTYFPDATEGLPWGQMFFTNPPFVPERGRWYAMEMMLKANTPGKKDGEQAFWIDGQKIGHWTGMRFRNSEILKVNAFFLLLFIHENTKINKVWFDEVVISTEYIGPIDSQPDTTAPARPTNLVVRD